MNVFLTGKSGRLGSVVAKTFEARGDVICDWGQDFNYMVFCHRYRGEPSYVKEMYANVEWVKLCLSRATWATGDAGIVIVTSVSSTAPAMDQSLAYNLSKAAQEQLVRWYARHQKIRCNAVSPDTFTGPAPIVSSQEVANVIAFLCSPQASGINGQSVRVG